MKILFLIPKNNFTFFGYRGISPTFPHLGVAYLISMLQTQEVEVGLFEDSADKTENDLFRIIDEFKPDLIGITIYTLSRPFAYLLIAKIKERIDIPIVLGGVHVTTVKKAVLEETRADFAIKYEGEYPLLELVNELKRDKPNFENINNLIWRKDRQIIENLDRSFLKDLDQLPFPQFDIFNIKTHPSFREKLIPLITSRGCPFDCNFCSVKLYMGRAFRKRSVENIFDEIKYQYSKGYRQFDFNDDCFTLDKNRAEGLLDLVIKSDLKIKFQFYNGLRADTVFPHILKKLREAGCFYISYGCESGNEKIIKKIKKGVTLQQVRNAVKWTRDAGIACSVNFIIGHREETYQTAMDSINFAKSLPTNFVNFYNLVPYCSTEAFEWAQKNGRFLVDTKNYLEAISYVDNKPIFETDELTGEQREKLMQKGFAIHEYRIFCYRFGKIIGCLLYILTRNKQLKIFAAKFSTMSKLGNRIAVFLSKSSYNKYTNN